MNFTALLQRIFSKKAQNLNLTDDRLKLISEMLRDQSFQMNDWDMMFGTLSFNIWNNSCHEFQKSQDIYDIEIPLLCSIGVFQSWEKLKISKKYDIRQIKTIAPKEAVEGSSTLIEQLPEIKYALQGTLSRYKIEPIKPFITIFFEKFIVHYKNKHSEINPRDFFQQGIEILFLFILELKDIDLKLYNDLKEYGEYQEEVSNIIDDLNRAS